MISKLHHQAVSGSDLMSSNLIFRQIGNMVIEGSYLNQTKATRAGLITERHGDSLTAAAGLGGSSALGRLTRPVLPDSQNFISIHAHLPIGGQTPLDFVYDVLIF